MNLNLDSFALELNSWSFTLAVKKFGLDNEELRSEVNSKWKQRHACPDKSGAISHLDYALFVQSI